MEERQVTVDGHTYPMNEPFLVVATQNPVEQEGTYRLPEAQLDRFLFKINVGYPTLAEEILLLEQQQHQTSADLLARVSPVLSAADILHFSALARGIVVTPKLLEYIARIVGETRNNPALFLGASPRASLALLKASKAIAAIRGRDFVVPEDITGMVPHVLRHRIILTPEKEMEGLTPDDLIRQMVDRVEVPR
jgi:MoxR-like ATPase